MSALLVTYSLNNKSKNYESLFTAIKSHSTRWFHYIDASWVVETNLSANDFAQQLYPYIETTDRLLVVGITGQHQGWLPEKAWEWLNSINYY